MDGTRRENQYLVNRLRNFNLIRVWGLLPGFFCAGAGFIPEFVAFPGHFVAGGGFVPVLRLK